MAQKREKLINAVNKRIDEYPAKSAIYITNKFFGS